MFSKIVVGLLIVLVLFAIIVVLQPSDFRVSRSATVAAPAASVFAEVNDLHRYAAWNPRAKADPAMKTTFEGPRAGPGAILAWSGNQEVGVGRMTITESRPNELVRMRLDFIKPFPSSAAAEFVLKSEGGQTKVTWSMFGRQSFIPKAIGLFMNMDKMIGNQFDQGLAEMKSRIESSGEK